MQLERTLRRAQTNAECADGGAAGATRVADRGRNSVAAVHRECARSRRLVRRGARCERRLLLERRRGVLVGRVRIRAGTFETYRHREHPRRARVAECIRIVRVGDMRGRDVRVCFRHFFDVRGRDMRVRDGQAQAACFAGECVHGRALATNISSARVFVTPVRVDRPRQKRPLRRHASASGITFVAHVEVRAVAIRQSRRAPRFAAAHALASCDPRRARPWPHAGNMLVRGMRVAACACARCVFPQAMHVSAARAAITTPAALRAKRHASRTSNAPVGCPDSIRLDPALFGSIRLYSARIKSTRIEPAAHAAGSRRSSIPHPSLHASATAPRIAPPAAVNPHRNCGDTRPDSSPRCA
ncbi:hypothetical protein DP49_3245 [Burkholderia pseudomallei]|nr:hypothetical protein DP49_3245 [Burkholderia pseudomallei]